ncbi:MAG TPA: 5'/3'-nucleotidase SurE [Devosia sp.]|nr:5'/3'-nucleotidase SurE [Devosia sp.]
MKPNPRILISNDDGIDAPGLELLSELAAQLSQDVWVVAPGGNQSGSGHRFTLGTEMSLTRHGERRFSVDGTPADCVVIGCTHVLRDHPPDIVLSGINHGQNMGDIIHCSGTAAAAREGALQGALGIALSQAIDYENQLDVSWECATVHGANLLKNLIANAGGRDTYYNINFPVCAAKAVSGVEVVPHQRFERSAFKHYPSKNADRFFISIPDTPTPMDPGHDFHVLSTKNAITITPLTLVQSDLGDIQRLQGKIALAGL